MTSNKELYSKLGDVFPVYTGSVSPRIDLERLLYFLYDMRTVLDNWPHNEFPSSNLMDELDSEIQLIEETLDVNG
jgi:hypothetical protein